VLAVRVIHDDRAGRNSVRIFGLAWRRGSYEVWVSARDAAGRARPRMAIFTVT